MNARVHEYADAPCDRTCEIVDIATDFSDTLSIDGCCGPVNPWVRTESVWCRRIGRVFSHSSFLVFKYSSLVVVKKIKNTRYV